MSLNCGKLEKGNLLFGTGSLAFGNLTEAFLFDVRVEFE